MTTALGHMERIRALAVSERVWAIGGLRTARGSAITLYDPAAAKVLTRIELDAHVLSLGLSGSTVIAGCTDGTVRLFQLSGESGLKLKAHQGECTQIALEADGEKVLSTGTDGFVRQWALATGVMEREWALCTAPLRALAMDPRGESFAAGGDDGVVRVVSLASGARREMNGHEGAVNALVFTPRDGRLASAGEDGTIRLWYLVGAVEFEARGEGDAGHKGAVHALAFGPRGLEDGKESGEKLFSAGADGALKVWRMDDRKRTRAVTLEASALRALAVMPASKSSPASVVMGFESRVIQRVNLGANGAPEEGSVRFGPLLEQLAADVWSARQAREAAVRALVAMDEPDAQEVLRGVIQSNDMASARSLAITEAARAGRRDARSVIVEVLHGGEDPLPKVCFEALRVLEGDGSLGPMREALRAEDPALRILGIDALGDLGERSPLARGMVASKLDDPDAGVRLRALRQWLRVSPSASEALRMAFERGPADLRREVIVHAASLGLLHDGALGSTVLRALDDADGEVRKTAFTALVLERRALVEALLPADPALGISLQDFARRAAQIPEGTSRGLTDQDLSRVREKIPCTDTGGAPTEADLAPLLTAIACRTSDTGLWGASSLASLRDARALGALLQLSREADPSVRAKTAVALSGLRDPRAQNRLGWMLDDQDANVRAAAREAYAKVFGVSALGVAEASLRSSQEDIRARGLDEVVKLGKGSAAEALLEAAMEDQAPRVRAEAFRTLWSWHDKTPEPALARAMRARFADLRMRAVAELASLGAKPWARARLAEGILDADEGVGTRAFEALSKLKGESDPEPCVAAMGAAHAGLRARGAQSAAKCAALGAAGEALLAKLLDDDAAAVRTAAVESLGKLSPGDNGALRSALAGRYVDTRVRAAELLSERRDEDIIGPMQSVISDKEALQVAEPKAREAYEALVLRAARALAALGSRKVLGFFAEVMQKHESEGVREQGARGLAMACEEGDQGYLVDTLGSPLAAARSWAADGLARLGDTRGMPVLTGNLRDTNLNLRVRAILSFAALGSEGESGLLQGIDDPSVEAQVAVFAVLLARDLKARRKGEPPGVLISALSARPPEARFGAARALELRAKPEAYTNYLIAALAPTVLGGEKGEKGKKLPTEAERGVILLGLAEALAGEHPGQRYAAAQVLLLRREPERFFREAERVAKPTSVSSAWIADTSPRVSLTSTDTPRMDWIKKLFLTVETQGNTDVLTDSECAERLLAFGVYVGLLRQTSGDEEGHRVRRSSVERLVELGLSTDIPRGSVVAALTRALDDPHYLVRKAAFAGLRRVFGEGSYEPLDLALGALSADVARGGLDELGARGAGSLGRVARALNHPSSEVRWHAFQWAERLSASGSQEPLLMALASEHGDLRIGVIERLSGSKDPRVTEALVRAMASERDDLRLRAAELLAKRRDDRAAEVLAVLLRSDNEPERLRALEALVSLGSEAAVQVLGRYMSESAGDRARVLKALGGLCHASAIEVVGQSFNDEEHGETAFASALSIAGSEREKRNELWALGALRAAAKAKLPGLREAAATELGYLRDDAANGILTGLFGDRFVEVRKAAVGAYGRRVIERGAPLGPMEKVLREGARELALPAAEALGMRGVGAALETLLLVARAGEADEQPRGILALGALGDPRALPDLEGFAQGGTEEIPVPRENRDAAIEALGRMAAKLQDPEVSRRVTEAVEAASASLQDLNMALAGLRGLRWIGTERARLLLEEVVTGRSERELRVEACAGLGALGDVRAEASLARAMRDPRGELAEATYEALRKLFPRERARVELHALKASMDEAAVSRRAASFLAGEGSPGEIVSQLSDLGPPELRKKLLYGLLRRGAVPVPELRELLMHADPVPRADAAWLIGAAAGQRPERDRTELADALFQAESVLSGRWAALGAGAREAEALAWALTVWAMARCDLGVTGRVFGRLEELSRASGAELPEGVRCEAQRAIQGRRAPAVPEKTLMDLVAARDAEALMARVQSATGERAKRDLIEALGRVGGEGARGLLAAMAFDKKNVEIGLRKSAFRALRRAQRAVKKSARTHRAVA